MNVLCAAIVLLCVVDVLLAHEPFQATSAVCDRAASRSAAHVLNKVFASRLAAAGYVLPQGCPLNVTQDMFTLQEQHKVLLRKNVWKCDFDGKTFKGESFIDLHMDKKHGNETHPDQQTCLGDFCGVLHCDFFAAADRDALSSLRYVGCHSATMQQNALRCQDVAHQCFPPHMGKIAEDLHAFTLTHFCAAATCSWKKREALLGGLAKHHDTQRYLWWVLVVVVLFVVCVTYGFVILTWSVRTPTAANSVQSLLQAVGLRKKARKLH